MCVSIEPYQKQTRYLGCLQTKIPGLFLIWRTPDRAFARPGTCPVAGEMHGNDSKRLHGDDSRRLHGGGAGEMHGNGAGEMHGNDSRRLHGDGAGGALAFCPVTGFGDGRKEEKT